MSGVALAQGIYYSVSGAWALVHIESFMRVTGPKHDVWLVKSVGGMLVASGVGLILAAWKGVISRIYLADAGVETAFLACWAAGLWA